MKLIQKLILIFLLALISVLTYIATLKFSGGTHFLYGKWVSFVFKNEFLLKTVVLLIINFSDVIVATVAGFLVGVIVKQNVKFYGFMVIAGVYILRIFIVVRGKLYYDSFYLYLVEFTIMSLSIIFCIIGAHIGSNLRKVLTGYWGHVLRYK